ncbi:hypothetical protein AWC38_SpisGene17925 [Stylophora pistillata]|uniref:K Homology domain-containing protein n=1 Tax=Stylophora pistillata TaxID=50429 RepID=A0A2B4RLN2_STYPI|nr:hypothetical protein AWC38_SpisGene17925 [Stylophora pistillata]
MSSVSGKVEESKGQDRKDEHKKRRAEGEPSWYEIAVDANFEEEVLEIPKNKVGLVIGKKGWKREDIISRSGIWDLFIKEDLVYIRGTAEQRNSAKQIIEKVLRGEDNPDQGSWRKLTFIPEDCMGKVIGKNRMNLDRFEKKTNYEAKLKVFERNSLYIKGSPESQSIAIRDIKETVRRNHSNNDEAVPENTEKATKFGLAMFEEWFQIQKEFAIPFEEMSPPELTKCLQKFYLSAKKREGSFYNKKSLTAIRAALDHHARENVGIVAGMNELKTIFGGVYYLTVLVKGRLKQSRPLKRFKDCIKANIAYTGIATMQLEECAQDRTGWRALMREATKAFEAHRRANVTEARAKRKAAVETPKPPGQFPCSVDIYLAASRLGKYPPLTTSTSKNWKKKFVARFVHVDTAYLEESHEFKLSIVQPSPNTNMRQKCFKLELLDDPLKEETTSGFGDTESLKKNMLGILREIHKEKEEEMVLVDIWCHFGHAYLNKVDQDEEDDTFTLEELKDRIESTADDCWKTFFSEVETIEVEQTETSLKDCACTTSDDIRYDFTFFTPSGLEKRVKVWLIEKEPGTEGASTSSLGFRRSTPLPVRNALTQVLPNEHSGDASNSPSFHICDTFHQRMKLDILMPSAGFDCRLKIRTFPKFPKTTPQADEERKIFEKYLMNMKIEDGQLNFPPNSELPDGFDLFFQRRSLRKTYQYEYDGDMFTLTVCKDQSKAVNPDQTDAYNFNESKAKPDVHLHCEEWDQVLNEGNWEPEQITAKLPKFLRFLRKVQRNVAPQ